MMYFGMVRKHNYKRCRILEQSARAGKGALAGERHARPLWKYGVGRSSHQCQPRDGLDCDFGGAGGERPPDPRPLLSVRRFLGI